MSEGLCPAGLEILAAVEQAKAQGVPVGRGNFGIAWDGRTWCRTPIQTVCAIGALLLGRPAPPPPLLEEYMPLETKAEAAAGVLGVPSAWVIGFVAGFDGVELMNPTQVGLAGQAAGRAVAQEVFRKAP